MNKISGSIVNRIGKSPVVILPLEDYEKMREDLEMLRSKNLEQEIKKTREEVKNGKILTLTQVKKALNLE